MDAAGAAEGEAGTAGTAGTSQRLAALSDQVGRIVQTVKQTVAEQLQAWSDAFFKDARSAASAIADKIDLVSDTMLGGCSDDGNNDVGNVQIPVSRAAVIDFVRANKPGAYAALVQAAAQLHDAPPSGARRVLSECLASVEKASGPAPTQPPPLPV